jgi:hypothetical protein
VLYTAPVTKKIMGVLDYKSKSPFGLALDRKLLGFFQWSTAYPFPTGIPSDAPSDKDFGRNNVFDPNGRWILDHQNARPFGDESVPEAESESAPSSGAGDAGGNANAGGGGQQANAAPGADNSPRVPGGTAGAAAGLAPQG